MVSRFLDSVWPHTGVYAIAVPVRIDGKVVFKHRTFETKSAAETFALSLGDTVDVYFCVHSLKQHKLWNPKKLDKAKNTLGAYEVRPHANTHLARCLFADIDVGAGDTKYPTQAAALHALKAFCADTGFPPPTVVSSGNGLHVYWPFDSDIDSASWLSMAKRLQQLAESKGLLLDRSRTSDRASMLRVPGTVNQKNSTPVQVLRYGEATAVDVLDALLPVKEQAQSVFALGAQPEHVRYSPKNTDHAGHKPSAKAIIQNCKQLQYCVSNAHILPEPLWYAAIGVLRHCADGHKAAHKISQKYPRYSAEETDAKLGQLELRDIGPTTCEKFAALNPNVCGSCRFKGVGKSPILLEHKAASLPPPVARPTPPLVSPPPPLPPAPHPYSRTAQGVFVEVKTKEGNVEILKLLNHDFYPVKRLKDPRRITEVHIWVANLPLVGLIEMALPAEAMYDTRKLGIALANRGVFAHSGLIPRLGNYMVAYIKQLQAITPPDDLYGSLGWSEDFQEFALPDKVLRADGTAGPITLDNAASASLAAVHKRGDCAAQTALLRFFSRPEYVPNQFAICAALGAPLFYMTGHHGVIVNMTGMPGASKSTTLYTCAGLWGHPEKYTINGTTRGATANARDNRIMALSNLPVTVDEITRMPAKDMADMAMAITQSEGRLRLDPTGAERRTAQTNKATIMLCTANTSLYTALSNDRADSTAESVRVIEMQFTAQTVHTKHEADDYLDQLKQNYGHIGEVFIEYVVAHRQEVYQRVRTAMRAVDEKLQITSSERFWSATAAVALVACEIASDLKLLHYDAKLLWAWLVTTQVPAMRGQMMHQYSAPVTILADYLEHINGNMLVLQKGHQGAQWRSNLPVVIRQPNNSQLLARHEIDKGTMWIQRKSFKDYCFKYGHNYTHIITTLTFTRVLHPKAISKVLGAGTDYAKGQVVCLMVDMNHPDISGEIAAQKLAVVPLKQETSRG